MSVGFERYREIMKEYKCYDPASVVECIKYGDNDINSISLLRLFIEKGEEALIKYLETTK